MDTKPLRALWALTLLVVLSHAAVAADTDTPQRRRTRMSG